MGYSGLGQIQEPDLGISQKGRRCNHGVRCHGQELLCPGQIVVGMPKK